MPHITFRPVAGGNSPGPADELPYTAVAEDLTFAEAEEWLDFLEGQGIRSPVVTINVTGRVSVWWAAA
jgi:hypothetical protein